MVWTAPMTFEDGHILTAAQLNTHLRDNLLETEVGKAQSTPGGYFISSGLNSIVQRFTGAARVGVAETATAGDYQDLTTVGPSVTVETGTRALVFIYCRTDNNVVNTQTYMSWEVSGATSRAPQNSTAIITDGLTAAQPVRIGNADMIDDLTPGSNTFTAKYKVLGGTGTWNDRVLAVIPF